MRTSILISARFFLLCLILLNPAVGKASDSLSVTFRYDDPGKQQIRVFVPAIFNNWGSNVNGQIAIGNISQMSYDSAGQYWWKSIKLAIDSIYAYKFHFHLDSSGTLWQWISDPLNPLLDNSGFNNSLVTIADPMIFEPKLTRDGLGNVSEVRAGIIGSASFSNLKLIIDNDSIDVSSFFSTARGILIYTIPSPHIARIVKLMATDNLSRSVTYQWLLPPPGSNINWKNEVFYQIFPRSFFDSNGDSTGDFNGITQKLDYLKNLGVTGLWLNPITLAHSYHNYFADNFDSTDTEFGHNSDFINLVKAVHAHGMKIFIDMEIQYISGYHLWYTSSYNNPASPYGSYIWYNGPNNTQPEMFTLYSYDGSQIPCITLRMSTPAYVSYQKRMWAYWMDPNSDGMFDDGVDGFRIDHIMDNLDNRNENTNLFASFWQPLFDTLRSINPDVFFLGEQADWGDYGSTTLTASGADAVFTIPLMFGIRSFDKNTIMSQIGNTLASRPIGKFQFTIIENHDVDRFASVAGGSLAKEKIGAALDLTFDGVPCLYYGQEIGMKGMRGNWGNDGNDIPNREAFKWYATRAGPGMALWYANTGPWWTNSYLHDHDGISVEEQQPDSSSLWNYYRKLILVRKSHTALREGIYLPIVNTADSILSYVRRTTGDSAETITVIINLGVNTHAVAIDFSQILGSIQQWYGITDLMGQRSFSPLTPSNENNYPLTLGGNEVIIAKVASTASSFSMTPGWNMLSLPLLVADGSRKTLFPHAVSKAFSYTVNGYTPFDTLRTGYGYWLKFDSVQTVTLQGAECVIDTITVQQGWNLVGSLSKPVLVSSILPIPPTITVSQFYVYNGSGYSYADTLVPWVGYWVKADRPGKLVVQSLTSGIAENCLKIVPTGDQPPSPPVDVGRDSRSEIPEVFSLEQNFPNPFNPTTTIQFGLPVDAVVTLKVFNILGEEIAVLLERVPMTRGYKEVSFNAGEISSGVYFYRLTAESSSSFSVGQKLVFTSVKRMALIK